MGIGVMLLQSVKYVLWEYSISLVVKQDNDISQLVNTEK